MKLNPSVIIVCVLLTVLHVVSSDMDQLVPYTIIPLLLLWIYLRIPVLYVLKRIALLIPFWTVVFVLHLFSVDMPVSFELLVMRTLIPVIIMSMLLISFSGEELMKGLKDLGLPGKTVVVMYAAYSSIEIIAHEYRRISRAYTARGGNLRSWRYAGTGLILGNLVLRCFQRSDRMHRAMVARGLEIREFGSGGFRMSLYDVSVLVASVTIIISIRTWI